MARKVIPAVTIYICDACGQQMSSEVTTPPGMVSNRGAYTLQWGSVAHAWEASSVGPKSASYEFCNPCGARMVQAVQDTLAHIELEQRERQ